MNYISNNNIVHSIPIKIPIKLPLPDSNDTYDKYTCSIPKYGSFENSNELNTNPIFKKCSESSDFPNNPFGKSPPDIKYIKDLYLNYVAKNNLHCNLG